MFLTRRSLLLATGGALATAATAELLGRRAPPPREPQRPIVDAHVHLFGTGDAGSGCFLADRQRSRANFALLQALVGLDDGPEPLDEQYVRGLVAQVRGSSIDKAVLFAHDGRYDDAGRFDRDATSAYTPNDWVLAIAARHPDLFIPCASINPRRRDAHDELDRVADRGVRAVKIHPPVQAVDPGDPRFAPFYDRCAARRVVVIVHTGPEHATDITGTQHCSPERLTLALERGCTAVAAHSGLGNFFDPEDFFADLLATVRRFENFYCETAMLGSPLRFRAIPRLLAEPEITARLVHGSDFPFPSSALPHVVRLPPSTVLRLCAEQNLLERDYRLKQALGVPAEAFERTARLFA